MFQKLLQDYVNGDNPMLYIACAGAGYSLAQLASIPGSSKVLDSFHMCYSYESLNSYLNKQVEKAVSSDTAFELMWRANTPRPSNTNFHIVGITGALMSNRYRKGIDQAYICTLNKMIHVEFLKASEAEHSNLLATNQIQRIRETQDIAISMLALYSHNDVFMTAYSNDPVLKETMTITVKDL